MNYFVKFLLFALLCNAALAKTLRGAATATEVKAKAFDSKGRNLQANGADFMVGAAPPPPSTTWAGDDEDEDEDEDDEDEDETGTTMGNNWMGNGNDEDEDEDEDEDDEDGEGGGNISAFINTNGSTQGAPNCSPGQTLKFYFEDGGWRCITPGAGGGDEDDRRK